MGLTRGSLEVFPIVAVMIGLLCTCTETVWFMARVKEVVLPLGIRPRGNMPRRQEGDLLMMMRTKILMIQIIDKHLYNIVITSHFYISNIFRNIYVKIISQLYI